MENIIIMQQALKDRDYFLLLPVPTEVPAILFCPNSTGTKYVLTSKNLLATLFLSLFLGFVFLFKEMFTTFC